MARHRRSGAEHGWLLLALVAAPLALFALFDGGAPSFVTGGSYGSSLTTRSGVHALQGQAVKPAETATTTPATLQAMPLGLLAVMALYAAASSKAKSRNSKVARSARVCLLEPVASKPAPVAETEQVGNLNLDFSSTKPVTAVVPTIAPAAVADTPVFAAGRTTPKGRNQKTRDTGFFARKEHRRIGSRLLRQAMPMPETYAPSFDPSRVPLKLQGAFQMGSFPRTGSRRNVKTPSEVVGGRSLNSDFGLCTFMLNGLVSKNHRVHGSESDVLGVLHSGH